MLTKTMLISQPVFPDYQVEIPFLGTSTGIVSLVFEVRHNFLKLSLLPQEDRMCSWITMSFSKVNLMAILCVEWIPL